MAMAKPHSLQLLKSDILLPILRRTKVLQAMEEVVIGSENLAPAIFTWKTYATHVFLAGSFDSWRSKIQLLTSGGKFFVILHVPVGTYQYLYCVDNDWMIDLSKDVMYDNGYARNTITVTSCNIILKDLAIHGKKVDEYKNIKYSQVVPAKPTMSAPVLPERITEDILNKDTPPDCHPALLPKPDRVLLNHVFVLRRSSKPISMSDDDLKQVAKEGFHTITRFRKIFVTTVYYW